jgi:effector-binding domain-containing protein
MVTTDVSLKQMDGVRVAFVPHRGPFSEIGFAFQRLLRLLQTRRLRSAGPMIALYYEEAGEGQILKAHAEAAVPVIGEVKPDNELRVRDLPPCTVASLIHDGPPSRYEESYAILRKWIKAHGYEVGGPTREIYARDLSELPPGILYAEIQVPIVKKRRR